MKLSDRVVFYVRMADWKEGECFYCVCMFSFETKKASGYAEASNNRTWMRESLIKFGFSGDDKGFRIFPLEIGP
jgi:hypothetical protein